MDMESELGSRENLLSGAEGAKIFLKPKDKVSRPLITKEDGRSREENQHRNLFT